jgi:hypothetical protein
MTSLLEGIKREQVRRKSRIEADHKINRRPYGIWLNDKQVSIYAYEWLDDFKGLISYEPFSGGCYVSFKTRIRLIHFVLAWIH